MSDGGDVRVCVWAGGDPGLVGSLLEPTNDLALAERAGKIATLPAARRLLEHPIGGFFRRDWGRASFGGTTFRKMIPARVCPMLLFVSPDAGFLHFAARLELDAAQGVRPRGVLRLAPAPFVVGASSDGISAVGERAVDLAELAVDEELSELAGRSWVVSGGARVRVDVPAYLGLALSGVAEGVRVAWSAVSQSCGE